MHGQERTLLFVWIYPKPACPSVEEIGNGRQKTTQGSEISIRSLQAELARRAISAGKQANVTIKKDLHASLEVSWRKVPWLLKNSFSHVRFPRLLNT